MYIACKRLLQILTHEEVRIGKACAEHVFVPFADGVNADIITISNSNKMCKQFSVFLDREIALMFLHHRDQHIARQGKKFFVESAHDCGGHFDEICYLVE